MQPDEFVFDFEEMDISTGGTSEFRRPGGEERGVRERTSLRGGRRRVRGRCPGCSYNSGHMYRHVHHRSYGHLPQFLAKMDVGVAARARVLHTLIVMLRWWFNCESIAAFVQMATQQEYVGVGGVVRTELKAAVKFARVKWVEYNTVPLGVLLVATHWRSLSAMVSQLSPEKQVLIRQLRPETLVSTLAAAGKVSTAEAGRWIN